MSFRSRNSSIADMDKQAIDLQNLVKAKKNNIMTEYTNLLKNVEENPYLQTALNTYKDLIVNDKKIKEKQINALESLLQGIDTNAEGIDTNAEGNADQNEIKREIKKIKENK